MACLLKARKQALFLRGVGNKSILRGLSKQKGYIISDQKYLKKKSRNKRQFFKYSKMTISLSTLALTTLHKEFYQIEVLA